MSEYEQAAFTCLLLMQQANENADTYGANRAQRAAHFWMDLEADYGTGRQQ